MEGQMLEVVAGDDFVKAIKEAGYEPTSEEITGGDAFLHFEAYHLRLKGGTVVTGFLPRRWRQKIDTALETMNLGNEIEYS
jgi:hypothetical protein